jgi:hypothetical protein
LQSQAVQRQAAGWVSTLRAHPADPLREGRVSIEQSTSWPAHCSVNATIPMKRIDLCCNILGDAGLDALLDCIREEIGILGMVYFFYFLYAYNLPI